MTRDGFALVKIEDGSILGQYGEIPNPLVLPTGAAVHCAVAGWEHDGYRVVERYVDDGQPPVHHVLSGTSASFDGTKVIVASSYALDDIGGRRATLKERIDSVWENKTTAGFVFDFGGSIGQRTLQTRFEDEPRWLAVKDQSNEAINAGHGGDHYPLPLRSADNRNAVVTYQQMADALKVMRLQQGALLGYSWALKDAVDAAADHAALDGIDINSGWPS